jgi:NADPH-dependent glutamate synthase beta subunit-like oxidoreductase
MVGRYRWMPEHPSPTSSEQDFFRFPERDLSDRRWRGASDPRRQKTVCVIGAGMAGLTAAYELATAGHKVVVVEADRRAGGRIST